MSIQVVNVGRLSSLDRSLVTTVYIGRKRREYACEYESSALGNPFKMRGESQRQAVIAKYRRWLWVQINAQNDVWDELNRLADLYEQRGELKLACWCAPKACHGDVVKSAIEWIIEQREAEREEPLYPFRVKVILTDNSTHFMRAQDYNEADYLQYDVRKGEYWDAHQVHSVTVEVLCPTHNWSPAHSLFDACQACFEKQLAAQELEAQASAQADEPARRKGVLR